MINFSSFFKKPSALYVSDTGTSNGDYGIFSGRPSFSGMTKSPELLKDFKDIEIKDVGSSLVINALGQCILTVPKEAPNNNFLALFNAPEAGEISLRDLELVASTMADKDVRYYLRGVFLCPSGGLVGIDGHRVTVIKTDCKFESAIVSRDIVLSAIKLAKMVKYKGQIVIRQAADYTGFFLGDYCVIGKNVYGKYVDYNRVLPTKTDFLCDVNPTDLVNWLKSVAPLIAYQEYPAVCFDDAGGIFVQHDNKKIYFAGQGSGIVIGICFDYLLKLVSLYKKEKTVSLRTGEGKLVLECGGALHIIMGVRV